MVDSNLERISKVLFFATLDEGFALEAAQDLIERVESDSSILPNIKAIISRDQKKSNRVSAVQGNFKFPLGVDISYWREFRIKSSREIFEPVLFSWIGKFNDEEICRVLEISSGTLYLRYNNGLKALGSLLLKGQSR